LLSRIIVSGKLHDNPRHMEVNLAALLHRGAAFLLPVA
jgi:hypothetical protein